MNYIASKLCNKVDTHYEVDPSVVFPSTLKRILEVLKGDPPVEIVSKDWKGISWRDPVVKNFVDQAEAFPTETWGMSEPPEEALAFATSWFKRALILEVSKGKGIVIHITNNPQYKMSPVAKLLQNIKAGRGG
jgi:hypothetical protein